jgi:hypothetical protein
MRVPVKKIIFLNLMPKFRVSEYLENHDRLNSDDIWPGRDRKVCLLNARHLVNYGYTSLVAWCVGKFE